MELDHVAVPGHWCPDGQELGLRRAGLGWLLGLGPGRERIATPVAERYRLSAFRDDAGEEGNDEGVERGAGFLLVLPLHSRNGSDTLGPGELSPRLRAVPDWKILHVVPGDRHRGHDLPDP